MSKKLTTLIMSGLFFVACHAPAMALNFIEIQSPIEIKPCYTATSTITAVLSIDSSGNASCTGKVKPSNSSYSTSLAVRLMKKSGNVWTLVKEWTNSGTGANGASASGSVKLSKGYTYQVKVLGSIKDSKGNLLESPTKNTPGKEY